MNNFPAMTGAWMTQQQMQSEANIYRHDNDEGTYAWFDATEALWTEGYLSPVAFHHIFKPNEAGAWLDNEIALLEEDGRDAKSYREIRKGETKNPVVVVFDNGRAIVWDGFHRIAAAVARNEPVYAIYTAPPAPVLRVPDGWIKCSERMPPSRTGVLVGCWYGKEWAMKWATRIHGHPDASAEGWLIPGASWAPTHWQPLPQPPEASNEQ